MENRFGKWFVKHALFLCAALVCTACSNSKPQDSYLADLTALRKAFVHAVFEGEVDDGPFDFSYNMRTVFFSKNLISLFGSFYEYTNLPHGHSHYEGKTFYRTQGVFKEITLNDLFSTPEQKEFLRQHCEHHVKTNQQASYFSGPDFFKTQLEFDELDTFVVDDRFLMIIFQPYTVAGGTDNIPMVKIPFELLRNVLHPMNPLTPLIHRTLPPGSYISSWDKEEFFHSLMEPNSPWAPSTNQ